MLIFQGLVWSGLTQESKSLRIQSTFVDFVPHEPAPASSRILKAADLDKEDGCGLVRVSPTYDTYVIIV